MTFSKSAVGSRRGCALSGCGIVDGYDLDALVVIDNDGYAKRIAAHLAPRPTFPILLTLSLI